jgi:hypothetical protein
LAFPRAQLDAEKHVGGFQLFQPPAGKDQSDPHAERRADPAPCEQAYAKTKPGVHIDESHTLPPIVFGQGLSRYGCLRDATQMPCRAILGKNRKPWQLGKGRDLSSPCQEKLSQGFDASGG